MNLLVGNEVKRVDRLHAAGVASGLSSSEFINERIEMNIFYRAMPIVIFLMIFLRSCWSEA